MSAQPFLFPETPEIFVARLDSEILALLMGQAGGPLSLELEDNEKAVLRTIRFCRGIANAINIRDIQARTHLGARSIKEAVRTLRMSFRLPIGSSKSGTDGGYYLILTDSDRAVWVKTVIDQVRAELAVVRAAAGRQATLELVGQLHLEASKDELEARL
jgi:hypothetical protein